MLKTRSVFHDEYYKSLFMEWGSPRLTLKTFDLAEKLARKKPSRMLFQEETL
jgi:hypothetical protein